MLIAEESTVPISYEERSKGQMRFPTVGRGGNSTNQAVPTSGLFSQGNFICIIKFGRIINGKKLANSMCLSKLLSVCSSAKISITYLEASYYLP